MHLTATSRLALLALITLILAGCGNKLSGTYAVEGAGEQAKMEFSGDKVTVSFLGQTKQGTYVIDGKTVKITISGQTETFTLDDNGCLLNSSGMLGKFCKK